MLQSKISNGPAFTANLKIKAADGMITKEEITELEKQVETIGTDNDKILVEIGNNYAGDVYDGYGMKMVSFLDGDIKEKDLSQAESCFSDRSLSKPSEVLKTFFSKMASATSKDVKSGVELALNNLYSKFEKSCKHLDECQTIYNEAKENLEGAKKEVNQIKESIKAENDKLKY